MLAFSEGLVYNSNAVKITIIDFGERRGTDNEKNMYAIPVDMNMIRL